MGVHYEHTIRDYVEAPIWYRKAADQGDAWAQNNLGLFLYQKCAWPRKERKFPFDVIDAETGEVVVPANKSITPARFREIARRHERIDMTQPPLKELIADVVRNLEEAATWFLRAAEHGHIAAQFAVGICYQDGNGIRQNYAEAFTWFSRAAARGHSYAQYYLGCCYSNGEGVSSDHGEAFRWFLKSANQGNALAQRSLALCYQNGTGVKANLATAYKWFQIESLSWFNDFLANPISHILARDRSDPSRRDVEGELKKLVSMMSPSEMESADRIWRELKERSAAKE